MVLVGMRALCQDIFIIQKLLICTDSAVVKSFIVIKVAKKQMFFLSNKVRDGELGPVRGEGRGVGRGLETGLYSRRALKTQYIIKQDFFPVRVFSTSTNLTI